MSTEKGIHKEIDKNNKKNTKFINIKYIKYSKEKKMLNFVLCYEALYFLTTIYCSKSFNRLVQVLSFNWFVQAFVYRLTSVKRTCFTGKGLIIFINA